MASLLLSALEPYPSWGYFCCFSGIADHLFKLWQEIRLQRPCIQVHQADLALKPCFLYLLTSPSQRLHPSNLPKVIFLSRALFHLDQVLCCFIATTLQVFSSTTAALTSSWNLEISLSVVVVVVVDTGSWEGSKSLFCLGWFHHPWLFTLEHLLCNLLTVFTSVSDFDTFESVNSHPFSHPCHL